jgi:hypothetical protein
MWITDLFRDYRAPLATLIAVASTFISLIRSEYFKDNPRAKNIVVLVTGVLGFVSVAGTFYSQYKIVSSANAEKAHNSMVREGLGEYIKRGDAIMNDFAQNKWPVVEENDWTGDVKGFLLANLKESYVSRFEDPSGLQLVTIRPSVDEQHDNEYIYMAP